MAKHPTEIVRQSTEVMTWINSQVTAIADEIEVRKLHIKLLGAVREGRDHAEELLEQGYRSGALIAGLRERGIDMTVRAGIQCGDRDRAVLRFFAPPAESEPCTGVEGYAAIPMQGDVSYAQRGE